LAWGSNILAKVIAINNYGNSLESNVGNGAIITTTPGTPTNLTENTTFRTKSSLGLTWNSPNFTGGSPILDYTVLLLTNGSY
jgi:hypothetical protein